MAFSLALFFRVVYGSSYTFLHLLLLALLMVSPGDIINQSRLRSNVYPILIVSICYLSAVFIAGFVYMGRLYTNRSVLNSIPKAWIPIEKGDVNKRVRGMISNGLNHSALVAFAAQPRALPPFSGCPDGCVDDGNNKGIIPDEDQDPEVDSTANADVSGGRLGRLFRLKEPSATVEQKGGVALPPFLPVWGAIEHPGWAPPDTGDGLANLQYSNVVAELPSLIEAKALTLAPAPAPRPGEPFSLDPMAVALLQRPPAMGLRGYLAHLAQLGVIHIDGHTHGGGGGGGCGGGDGAKDGDSRPLGAVVASFVDNYEYARFSAQMLTQTQFRQLMRDLAVLLRRMRPLHSDRLLDDADDSYDDDDDDDEYDVYDAASFTESANSRRYSTEDVDSNAARSTPTTMRSLSRQSSAASRLLRRPPHGHHAVLAAKLTRSGSTRTTSSAVSGVSGVSGVSNRSTSTSGSGNSNGTSRHHRLRPGDGSLALPKKRQKAAAAGLLVTSRPSSASSFAPPRRTFPVSKPSISSLRSATSSGSVIRLTEHGDSSGLPYVLLPMSAHSGS